MRIVAKQTGADFSLGFFGAVAVAPGATLAEHIKERKAARASEAAAEPRGAHPSPASNFGHAAASLSAERHTYEEAELALQTLARIFLTEGPFDGM